MNPFLAPGYRVVVLGFALVFGCAAASADTIVLKNGRRILAFNVVEAGEKIRYETNAGELSLPKSSVDHIEKGGAVPMDGSGSANASNLAITPPAMDAAAGGSGGEIERRAVHDGAIDREYIAKLEGATRGGSSSTQPAAGIDAAVGHHAAAMFELGRGDMDHALADERTALTYAPDEPSIYHDGE